jgi:c-di-GMP-binding flagellar brake protein YcgR
VHYQRVRFFQEQQGATVAANLEKQFFDPNAPDSELDIPVGTLINVQLERMQRGTRHSCRLIGYRKGRSIVVSMPVDSEGNEVPYYFVNDEVTLRYFCGREVHGFKTWVSKVCKDPFSYLHLAFPDRMERVRVREEPRTQCSLPATVTGGDAGPVEGRVVDLSANGAQLEYPGESAEIGAPLKVSLEVEFAGHELSFELAAEIRNRKKATKDEQGNRVQRVGVSFVDLSEQDKLRLTGYVYESIVARRIS